MISLKHCLLFIPFLMQAACSESPPLQVKLMTYNIRLDHAGDNEDNWHQRKADVVDYIEMKSPDIFGVQEALPNQMDYLAAELSEYKYIGVGRDDGKRAGEFSAIFYKVSDWTIEKNGTFWLSETPEQPSLGWDANIKRVCTYGHFKHKDGRQLAVFNTHFDHQGKLARSGSVDLLQEKVPALAEGLPIVLMGDFNFSPDDQLYKDITTRFEDTFKPSELTEPGTFNGFRRDETFDRRIDYIFLDKDGVQVDAYTIEQPKTKAGRQVSDHFPVLATIKL